jgi:hypothetical protein
LYSTLLTTALLASLLCGGCYFFLGYPRRFFFRCYAFRFKSGGFFGGLAFGLGFFSGCFCLGLLFCLFLCGYSRGLCLFSGNPRRLCFFCQSRSLGLAFTVRGLFRKPRGLGCCRRFFCKPRRLYCFFFLLPDYRGAFCFLVLLILDNADTTAANRQRTRNNRRDYLC